VAEPPARSEPQASEGPSQPQAREGSRLDRHPRDRLRRALGLHDAVFLVVASVVGSGIFLTPGPIASLLPHAGLILAVWVAGGLLSLAGALANAELGASFPHAGGDYVYLREAFHPLAGFLAGWLSFFGIFAGTVATLAAGFAQALDSVLGLSGAGQIAVAVATILACSWLNVIGVRHGARANNVTGWIKVGVLAFFVVVAPLSGRGDAANLRPFVDGIFSAAPPLAFALALSPVLFSYLGWNATVFVASEIHDPGRNVPRSLFIGLGLSIALYLALNLAYLYAVPPAQLAGAANAGELAAAVVVGARGGGFVTAFVLISILGTLNATILVGPRIVYAMALDQLFLRVADRVHAEYATPTGAIWLQAAVACGLVLLLETFPKALDFTTFGIVLATIADTLALFALRRRQPDRPRPYRAWGYPFIPLVYLAANAAIGAGLLFGRPREAGIAVLVLASGVPVYFLFRKGRLARA
jgi:APA family basic amino acid/polyamine antiporter